MIEIPIWAFVIGIVWYCLSTLMTMWGFWAVVKQREGLQRRLDERPGVPMWTSDSTTVTTRRPQGNHGARPQVPEGGYPKTKPAPTPPKGGSGQARGN